MLLCDDHLRSGGSESRLRRVVVLVAAVIGAEIQETEIFASLPWRSQDAKEYSYYEGRWVNPQFTTYDSPDQINLCLNCPFADECKDCVTLKHDRKVFRKLSMKGRFRIGKRK